MVLPNLLCVLSSHAHDYSVPSALFPYPSLAKSTWQSPILPKTWRLCEALMQRLFRKTGLIAGITLL